MPISSVHLSERPDYGDESRSTQSHALGTALASHCITWQTRKRLRLPTSPRASFRTDQVPSCEIISAQSKCWFGGKWVKMGHSSPSALILCLEGNRECSNCTTACEDFSGLCTALPRLSHRIHKRTLLPFQLPHSLRN